MIVNQDSEYLTLSENIKVVLRILLLRMLARVVVEMVVTKGVNKVVKTEVGKTGDKLRTDTIPETIFD